MKERPILFSGAMIRAILAGQKTQTRRAAKPVKHPDLGNLHDPGALASEPQHVIDRACPYGQPGERLWVREAWDFLPTGDNKECMIRYFADGAMEQHHAPSTFNPMIYGSERKRPSIHMPRWASRILLEIVSIRVERLHNISEADAVAEGVAPADHVAGPPYCPPLTNTCTNCGAHKNRHVGIANACFGGEGTLFNNRTARGGYAWLWEQINGHGSWAANPWVWVVEFKRVEATP